MVFVSALWRRSTPIFDFIYFLGSRYNFPPSFKKIGPEGFFFIFFCNSADKQTNNLGLKNTTSLVEKAVKNIPDIIRGGILVVSAHKGETLFWNVKGTFKKKKQQPV